MTLFQWSLLAFLGQLTLGYRTSPAGFNYVAFKRTIRPQAGLSLPRISSDHVYIPGSRRRVVCGATIDEPKPTLSASPDPQGPAASISHTNQANNNNVTTVDVHLEYSMGHGTVGATESVAAIDIGEVLDEKKSDPVIMSRKKAVQVEDMVGQLLRSINPKLNRLWTRADFLHAHAVSGLVFMIGGPIWQAARVADLFNGGDAGGWLSSDSGFCAFLAIAGLINAISAIPMSQFSSNKFMDLTDLKGNGFSLGGTGLTGMCLWLAWWFSGAYPEVLHTVDGEAVVLFSLLCVATTVNWELMVQKNFSLGDQEEDAATSSEREVVGVGDRAKRTRQDRKLAGVISTTDSEATVVTKRWLYRIASWPNLTQILFMSSIGIGGAAWLNDVAVLYPDQSRMLFDYSFASALGYALSMFAETLRDRKLLSLKADFVVLLIGVIAPMVVVAMDAYASGPRAQINPFEYWSMFQQHL